MKYEDFIKEKANISIESGFEVSRSDIHKLLFPHQNDTVRWCLKGGRRAIFAAFGLGKSFMQLEIMRQIQLREGGKQLIIMPLGVRQEFKRDAEKLGITLMFIRKSEEVKEDGLYITNYESVRDGKLDVNLFNATSLDEASVLRSFGSKTYQNFLTLFSQIKYRFVATATPSPNRTKELIHYAGYLGIMDTGQALTRWFKRDSTKANNLTLYPHKEDEFWLWLATWALFLQKPSDLGYSDDGYSLPKLNVIYHEVDVEDEVLIDSKGQYVMFKDSGLSLKDASKCKRDSLPQRIEKMVEILDKQPEDNFLLWHDQEVERHAIKKAVKGSIDIYGSMDLEIREQRVLDFSDGKIQHFATKPVLSGSGCNFQRYCNNAIFLGIGFKFNDFIQSVHRIYRFLQGKACNIHIIYASTEKPILEVLKQKWENHDIMVEKMTGIIKKYGLSHIEMAEELKRSMGVERVEVSGDNFILAHNDCVEEVKLINDDSIGLVHTSIPFSNHYEYSPSYNDFGHTTNNNHFWEQMDFLTPELYRILMPGRIYAVHVKDRILFGNVTGAGIPTVSPFHMETALHGMKHGFDYVGMITVVTDVVRENNQTYRLGWTEQCKDGSKMGVGSPEYIILLHKPQTDRSKGYADIPVTKSKEQYSRARWQIDAHAFWRDSGNRLLTEDDFKSYDMKDICSTFKKLDMEKIYDYESHVKIGEHLDLTGKLPTSFMSLAPNSWSGEVWTDINRMDTLNSQQSKRAQNLHICPLQFGIIERIIQRYSNEGEWVFDPFSGLGSVPYKAVMMNRKGRGSELSRDYFLDSVKYLEMAEREKDIPDLFSMENLT